MAKNHKIKTTLTILDLIESSLLFSIVWARVGKLIYLEQLKWSLANELFIFSITNVYFTEKAWEFI